MRPTIIALCLPAVLIGGCSTLSTRHIAEPSTVETTVADSEWRAIARPIDQQRVDAVDTSLQAAVADLPRRLRPHTAADKQLLDPQAARPLPALTPGGYQCRRIRLGGRTKLTRFKPDTCYVKLDGDRLSYTTQSGSMMPGGWLYADGGSRLILIATDRPAKAEAAPAYGLDADRDLVGAVERIGPMRWRLTIPRADEIDIWELTPWPKQQLDD